MTHRAEPGRGGGDALLRRGFRPVPCLRRVGWDDVAGQQHVAELLLTFGIAGFRGTAIPGGSFGRVVRQQESAEITLAEAVATLGAALQPVERGLQVDSDAGASRVAGPEIGLGARDAGLGQRRPDRERLGDPPGAAEGAGPVELHLGGHQRPHPIPQAAEHGQPVRNSGLTLERRKSCSRASRSSA